MFKGASSMNIQNKKGESWFVTLAPHIPWELKHKKFNFTASKYPEFCPQKHRCGTPFFKTFFRMEDFYAFRDGLQKFYTSRSRFWAFKGIERKLRNYRNTFRTIDSSADWLVDLGLRNAYYGTIFGTKLSSSLQISEHILGYWTNFG